MSANTPTTIASRFKQRFNKSVTEVIPNTSDILRRCEFRQDMALGASAEFDVRLSPELGFSQGQGRAALNGAIAQTSKRASVNAYSLILQSEVSYDAVTRSKGDDRAFASFASQDFIPMIESFRGREEFHALLGRDQGLGKVTANAAGVITISEDTWIPALASQIVGAVVQAWTSKLTATDASGSQHNGDLTITGVNLAARQFTVSGTSAAVAAGDYLYFKGDYTLTSRIGLLGIARNTGTLFGIDASAYPLWCGNTHDLGTSAITLGKILQGAAKAGEKGCAGKKLVCYVPMSAFQSLVADEAALVTHGATKKAQNGFETLEFLGGTGQIEVVPHLWMPDGVSLLWCPEYTYILGSQEATNKVGKDDIFFDLENVMAKEMRMYSDTCGVFTERPGFMVVMTRSDNKKLAA